MTRALSSWSRPPRERRRTATHLDNVALVPASELASLQTWQLRAQRLPAGNSLVVVPKNNPRLRDVSHRIKTAARQRGLGALIALIESRR
jgi:hypothetical protein